MGILAYLGLLVIVPYIVAKDDPFVKFHIKQGLVLLVIEVIMACLVTFLAPLLGVFSMFVSLINLGVFVLAIVGIVHVARGEMKELPLVGSFGNSFSI